MSNVKKIILVIIGVIVITFAAVTISGIITQNRATKIYNELKNRYDNIEQSNIKLTEINIELKNNNIQLRNQITEINSDIKRANIVVGNFEESIKIAGNTIERIEITVGFIEQIIDQLPEKIIILEEGNNN